MKELLLEHRGFTCIAKLYEDGRWGVGKNNDTLDSPFDFFWYADNEKEARERFAYSVDVMIEKQEYQKTEELWKSTIDYKSIAAVYNIIPKIVENRIKEGQFDKTLLEGVEGGDFVVPLYYVTKAWDNLLKGSLGSLSFMIGPEEDEDFSEEELREFLNETSATRCREEAIAQNDQMKEIWKKYFGIDIDTLDIDFTKFDMHLPPNVTRDEYYFYFEVAPNGINDWIMGVINHPSENWIYHEVVSCLMEFTANVIKFERFGDS